MAIVEVIPLSVLGPAGLLPEEEAAAREAGQLSGLPQGLQGRQRLPPREPLARTVLVRLPRRQRQLSRLRRYDY